MNTCTWAWNAGGSDTTSGLVSNPATGLVADQLVDAGGTVILSETTEWMGAENILLKRAVTPGAGGAHREGHPLV